MTTQTSEPKSGLSNPTWRKSVRAASLIAFIAGLFSLMSVGTSLFYQGRTHSLVEYLDIQDLNKYMKEAKTEIATLRSDVDRLRSRLDAASSIADSAHQFVGLKSTIDDASARLERMEKAIMADPEKALSIPLLRAELAAMASTYQRDLQAYGGQIDRIYDQNKWFIGLIGTMALGLVGLGVSNFIQAKKK